MIIQEENSACYFRVQSEREQTLVQGRFSLLPARASEQGNVIGSVRIYMCVQFFFVIDALGI